MLAKVLMMECAKGTQVEEMSAFDREIARQNAESERRGARLRDVPDYWPEFAVGCRRVGEESEQN